MRVLIADDENLARANLKSLLQDLDIPVNLVGEASNGEELVELVKQTLPDIAFVDIRMPKVNGLEAIKAAKAFSPETKWFILTGFSEFDYAKEAIRLGTVDYLLKPISPDELRSALRKVDEECRRQQHSLNKQFERDIMALYHGISSIHEEPGDIYLRKASFIGTIFYIDSHLPEKAKAAKQSILFKNIKETIAENVSATMRLALFALPIGESALVMAWTAGGRPADKFLQHLDGILRHAANENFKVTALQTGSCDSFESLHERMERLQELSRLRSVVGLNTKWTLNQLEQIAKDSNRMALSHLIMALDEANREVNYLDFMRTLPKLEKAFEKQSAALPRSEIADFLNTALSCEIDNRQPISEWIAILGQCGEQLLSQARGPEQPDLVSQVIAYVDAHYQADIGVAQIADQLKITPNYLSAIFRRKTGTSFVRYLTQIRMLKAKEFLADPAVQVQQVAESVGYYNSRYFAKLFTEFTGYTPSEYRNQL